MCDRLYLRNWSQDRVIALREHQGDRWLYHPGLETCVRHSLHIHFGNRTVLAAREEYHMCRDVWKTIVRTLEKWRMLPALGRLASLLETSAASVCTSSAPPPISVPVFSYCFSPLLVSSICTGEWQLGSDLRSCNSNEQGCMYHTSTSYVGANFRIAFTIYII
jgi:hypothetical protein